MKDHTNERPAQRASRILRSKWFLVVVTALWIPAVIAVAVSSLHIAWKATAALLLAILTPSLQDIVADFRGAKLPPSGGKHSQGSKPS